MSDLKVETDLKHPINSISKSLDDLGAWLFFGSFTLPTVCQQPAFAVQSLKLNPDLGFNSRPERMLNQCHFGYKIGHFDQIFGRIASG